MSSIRKAVQWGPPVWSQTPTPSFTFGTAATYSLATLVSEPSGTGYTLSVVGTLPTGVTLSGTTLTYSGGGSSNATATVQIRATNAGGTADSAPFSVTLTASSTGQTLLSASDISYLGYWDFQLAFNDSTYTKWMTLRRVGTDVRLLTLELDNTVREVSVTGRTFGTMVNNPTTTWNINAAISAPGKWEWIWWDEAGQRLWCGQTEDYSGLDTPVKIWTFVLTPGGGTISAASGPVGLQGVGSKRTRSGALSIPASFQASMGLGPYGVGLGAYTSLQEQGGSASMGLALYAIPSPSGYAANSVIPTGSFKTLATRSSTPRGNRIWYGYDYALGVNADGGKGPLSYYDGNPGAHDNNGPSGRPQMLTPNGVFPWNYPTPLGNAYWTWGDQYVGGYWIDTPTRKGVLLLGDFGTGKNWYFDSTLHMDHRTTEAHIFDPAQFAEVLAATRSANAVEPSVMIPLTQADTTGIATEVGFGPKAFAAFDPVGKRMYVHKGGPNFGYISKIHVYSLNI